MNCPRCRLPLRTVRYEGVDADMCNVCWGFWLDGPEFEEVVRNTQFEFTEAEKAAILDIRSASVKGPTAPAPCPRCGVVMARIHYDSLIHLVIDRCEEHGVWLDTGEIKKVQALASHSDEYHTLLLRRLGIIPQA